MKNVFDMDSTSSNEQHRLEALQHYHIIDTPPERSFDNIGKLATQFFDLPVAMISFIDTENVFLKTTIGIDITKSIPRNNSLCSLTLIKNELTVFENIPEIDHCFPTDGVSAADYGFKFYAGMPLVTRTGFSIGVICVMGMETRTFSAKEEAILKNLAVVVMDEIELRLQGTLEAKKAINEAIQPPQSNSSHQSVYKGQDLMVKNVNQQVTNQMLIKAIQKFAAANKKMLTNSKDLKQTQQILKSTLDKLPPGQRLIRDTLIKVSESFYGITF